MMDWMLVISAFIFGVMILSSFGMPVALAFLTVNIVGAYVVMGGEYGLIQTVYNTTQSISTFALVPVAMFILMGELFFRTGLAVRVFDAVETLLGRVPGRLSYVAIGGGTIFASLSGSSMANSAMMGATLAPSMFSRGYHSRLVYGPIMGAGCLAALIPPSGLAVLLASLGNIDVGRLLIGGILPGLMIAIFYLLLIAFQVWRRPEDAPSYAVETGPMIGRIVRAILNLAPMGVIVFAVIGMIVLGLATPTESSAFGVLAVLLVSLFYGKLSVGIIADSLMASARNTALLLFILLNSATFSQVLAFTGASSQAVQFALSFDFGATEMVIVMIAVLLVLGTFMDQTSMMMITFPVFLPIVAALQLDLIWFGILVLVTLEMALLTPPFGLLLFVMLGTSPKSTTFGEVVAAATPYFLVQVVALIALIAWPSIATFLPSQM